MVPVETSSGYLANERMLLPEDAVRLVLICNYLFLLVLYLVKLSSAQEKWTVPRMLNYLSMYPKM